MSRYSKTKEKYLLTFYGMHDDNAPDVVFNITNQGTTNYTSVPTITITPTPATLGVGMRATCTLTAGKVTSITLLSNKRSNYLIYYFDRIIVLEFMLQVLNLAKKSWQGQIINPTLDW